MKAIKLFIVVMLIVSSFGVSAQVNQEAKVRSNKIFKKLDADKDGKLSIDEYKRFDEQRVMNRNTRHNDKFARFDMDQDNKITFSEFENNIHSRKKNSKNSPDSEQLKKVFDKKDCDKNGVITRSEFMPKKQMMHKGGKIHKKGMRKRKMNHKMMFQVKDRNKDGYLSPEEFFNKRRNNRNKGINSNIRRTNDK